MTSSVFFKFKSQKEPSRVEFDGTGISVFELKRDIIIKSGLGDGTEFDLAIYNEDGNEEYDDDTTIIPRSTSIIARRLPPLKPGAGRAARYMTGKMPVNAKNSSRKESSVAKSMTKPPSATTVAPKINNAMTEEEKMQAMFQAQSEQWSAQQDEMANQTPVHRPGANKKGGPPPNVPDHEPPSGYICYRCGEKGHWIQVCPTNDDPNFDNKPRVKRTTGIPRSFLKTVEKPVALSNDGTGDDTKAPSGVMVNAEGEYVIALTDVKSWEKFQAKTKSSAAAQKAAEADDKELQDRGLECSVDNRMFVDPMKTPCCGKTFCNDCVTNALIESDFVCPACQTAEIFIDNLIADDDTKTKIKEYLKEKSAAKKEKERSKTPEVQAEATIVTTTDEPAKEKTKSPSPARQSPAPVDPRTSVSPSKAPSPAAQPAIPTGPKKRPADELLENPKVPKGPKAMQQQMNNGMNPMNGFQNMPFDISQFGGMNYGMGGMPMMPGFNGMPMIPMNPMMGMPPFPMNGFPNMNMNMNGMGMGMGPNMFGNMPFGGNNAGMGMGMGNGQAGPNAGGFPNQQQNTMAGATANEEDNAYFRKPVNPHRHQARQRKARPSDFREV